MIEDVISQRYWKSGMNILIDSRTVDYSKSTVDVMRAAGENIGRFGSQIGSSKAAVLMGNSSNFGKGRQFEQLAEGKSAANIRIFAVENEAIHWLDEIAHG